MTSEATTKAVALELLREGLATQSEVAKLIGISRQTLAYWVKIEGLDPVGARQAWLQQAWKQALRTSSARPIAQLDPHAERISAREPYKITSLNFY